MLPDNRLDLSRPLSFCEAMNSLSLFAAALCLGFLWEGEPDLNDPKTLDKILSEAISEDRMQERGREGEKLSYAPNSQTPYTGWVKVMHENGQVEGVVNSKDGKADGPSTMWYENGQKKIEVNFKDGKADGLWTSWDDFGNKASETTCKNGVKVKVELK